nr:unnamed protein product [Brassica oleracea]
MVEVDQIYHLACHASPIFYKYNPAKKIKTNATGTLNMLGLAKRVGAKNLLTSTSEVYGDPLVHPQTESYWGNVNPIEIRIARIFNTYGPRMNIDDGRVVSNFIAQALRFVTKASKVCFANISAAITELLAAPATLTVQKPGTQTRNFCYVSDMETRPINIGNSCEFTMVELAETVKDLIKLDVEIKMVENTPDDPRQRKPDISKAKEVLGWEPKVKLCEGLPLMEEDFCLRLGVLEK